MTTEQKFNIFLSKNRIAREMKRLYKALNERPPDYIKFDFDEIEKMTGTMNQPTGREILESTQNI